MKHLSIIFALLFISFPSFADFSSSQCSSLHAGDDFSVWFKLAPSSGEDTIYTTKRNGGSPTPIWSNNSSVQSPVIDDNETSNGEFYEVWLEYQSVTNKSGWLTYNLWEGSSWRQVGTRQYADLSGLSSAIAVSGDGASEIKCDDDITEPPPSYSPQALYQFGVMQCNGSECKIPLNKPFTNTPLVFVMPTIGPSNPDSDAPATLVVTNVTKTEATIEQIKAPKNGGGSDLTSQPMTEVSYLAIEPGVADFNGHEVIAGYLDTNRYKSKNGTNGNAESVAYSTFGAQQAFNSPVVLHQLQTRNNGSRWVTSGKLIGGNDNNEARLFLELSASRVGNNYQEERVGFIATNSTSGATLEVDGYKVQFARGYDTPSQNGNDPMLDGCEDKYATTSLANIDGVIANKQERAGGHGGWLRRCNINNDQVSFAVDEDFRDRTHIPEEVGYFAFELEDVPLDICDIAPYAVQSWSNNSSLIWTSNTASIQIEGTYQSSGQVGIWVDPTNPTVEPKAQCDGKECVENSSLYVAEPNIVDLDLPIGQNVDAGWQNIELSSGKYNTVSAGGSGTINLTGDTYYIEHFIVGASGKIILSQDTKIYVNSFELSGTGLVINNDFKLSIWAENYKGHSASVQVERNLNALIFSRDKVLVTGGNGLINGRVTAKHIELRPDGKIIDDGQFCPVQPSDYQLSLTPNKDFSLLCETPQVTVTVTDTQGNPATEQVEVYITTPAGMTVSSVTEGSYNGGASYSTSSSGILTLELDADSIGTYKIEAELATDSNQNDSGDFLVSLYKLEASDVYAIAGKDAEFTLKVLACKNDSVTPVSGYSGSKNLDISQFTLLKPSLSEGAQDGGLLVSGDGGITWSNSSTTFDFTDAQATPNGKLNYDESGSVSFKLSDPDFECPTGYDCEDNEGGDLDALEGVVNVFVRPWKIAICDIKETSVTTNSNPATTTGSPGFMASGENFSVKYRPIVFGSGDECNLDVTTNYARDSGPINVSFKLAYPNIVDGDLNITPAVVGPFDNFSELVISNYLWDEVGSVQFKTSATYLTMDLNEDTELVGRFYPKYFTTIGTPIWDYPGSGVSEQSFAYMNQPFDGVEFEVEALNALGNAIENYASFDSTLTAGFSLFEPNFGDRFNSPVPNKVWTATNNRNIGTFTLSQSSPSTDCDSELCLEKLPTADNYEDGPYNGATGTVTDISITHTGSADDDPVAYLNEEGSRDPQRLTEQPEILFGRVDLDDVGGNSETTITIPLRTEYWNGSRFVVNDVDSTTNVAASTSASDVVWSEGGGVTTTVTFDNGGQVSGGESRNLTASQGDDVSIREQVQLWQNMDDIPWLRYDWDSDKVSDEVNGEQDPSTVVTFGIYRGNDRVIYRGESGLTGQ
ncbi:hypothetical protein BCU98_09615 [Vibrio splendidus]|uniref:DUF6701 domain-containing protein n=1 Tax=Vibrio splendidus TaxID=29497 RepID=UPI000C84BA37|nr:DUF6701 domain-containing protein [Vibrio splendidus]MBU2912333.1 hypothetical protein [Vibrio splendidus]MDO6530969.1 hypothetical protein [Vibrio splendidus]MDO6552269.1 hypothetical protein [Vibrio splendidus]PMG08617.1 hypothetical protein BCU98_09615 [Vibrio splendidus]